MSGDEDDTREDSPLEQRPQTKLTEENLRRSEQLEVESRASAKAAKKQVKNAKA